MVFQDKGVTQSDYVHLSDVFYQITDEFVSVESVIIIINYMDVTLSQALIVTLTMCDPGPQN